MVRLKLGLKPKLRAKNGNYAVKSIQIKKRTGWRQAGAIRIPATSLEEYDLVKLREFAANLICLSTAVI